MTHHASPRPADPFTERTPRVVAASKLHRAAARRKAGRFLAEGRNAVEAALAAGVAVECFMTADALSRHEDVVAAAADTGVPVSPVTPRAMAHLSDTVTPPGLVAVCSHIVRRATGGADGAAAVSSPAATASAAGAATDFAGRNAPTSSSIAASSTRPRLVAVGEALAEPGNVGTLIRVADALGADEVWLTENSADPEGPKAVRASAGSLFYVPVVTGIAVADVAPRAAGFGLNLLVASGDGDVDITASAGLELLAQPAAWVFGNEAHGVAAQLRSAATACVSIPIRGRAESLNIATAAAICLHSSATALAARH